jgi:diketogulonate reductase-like aldo/keto reductase
VLCQLSYAPVTPECSHSDLLVLRACGGRPGTVSSVDGATTSFPAEGGSCRVTDDVEMPVLGLGVWKIPGGAETERAVLWALEAGYRHIDTAQAYGNEASVGRAIGRSGLSRENVFVTTKFLPSLGDPVAAAERSIERLGIPYVDLYLVHWPQGGPLWAWSGMEEVLARGFTRAIGVSNFDVDELEAVVAAADVAPHVNQIELNPFHVRGALLCACKRHGILAEAYSPLSHGRDLDHPALVETAGRYERTPAQILLRWSIQHGFPTIPKSARRERILENAQIFDFTLSDEDVVTLDGLDRTGGTGRAVERKWWGARGRARDAARRLWSRG